MQITLNGESYPLEAPLSVTQLLVQLRRPETGSAVAINQAIIPRSDWPRHQLAEGDNVLVFQAVAGG